MTRVSGIYAPNGDFISFESARSASVLGEDFATSSRAMGFDPATLFGMLPDPDPVLRDRGEDASILHELEADDEVGTGIEKRTLRTLNKTNFTFSPGHAEGEEPTELAVTVCKLLERDLADLKLRTAFGEILETVFYGPTFSELSWEMHNGHYKLVAITSKPRDWFAFNDQRKPVFQSMDTPEGEPLPPFKFLMTRHRASYDNPYGKRLLTRCLWPVAFKRGGIEFWSRFCEKFGSAFMIAKAGKDAQERNVIAAQLVSMIQDAVAVLPPNSDVDLVQAASRAGDLHKSFVSHWNTAISKILTGQHLSTNQDGNGSRAAAETHSAQLDALAESDQAMLVDSMNDLARIYTKLNFGDDIFPPVFEFTEPEDHAKKAELGKSLHSMGVRFLPKYFENKFGMSPDEFYMDSSPESASTQKQEPAVSAARSADSNFSAADDVDEYQQAIDRLADKLTPEVAKINEGLATQIENIVEQAESFEDIHAGLAELLDQELDQYEMDELLSNAMLNAQLAGRAAVHGDSDD
ncbi:MAG TPA: DUF935 domain-containing protein [Desulfovibrio sp.]|nr:DUF935 domain-containing protein [Desulfovibrio sp.]